MERSDGGAAAWECEHNCGFKNSFETVSAHEAEGGCVARAQDMDRARLSLNHPAIHDWATAPSNSTVTLDGNGALASVRPPVSGRSALGGGGLGVHRLVFGARGPRVHVKERGDLDNHDTGNAADADADAAAAADADAIYERLLQDVDTVDASTDGGATHWIPAARAAATAGPQPTLLEELVCAVFRSHTRRAAPGCIDPATSGAEWWAQQRVIPERVIPERVIPERVIPERVIPVVAPRPTASTASIGDHPDGARSDGAESNAGAFVALPAEQIAADPSSQQWHWDKDLAAFAATGATIHPQLSTVTYLTDGGSPTCVAEVAVRPSPRSNIRASSNYDSADFERCAFHQHDLCANAARVPHDKSRSLLRPRVSSGLGPIWGVGRGGSWPPAVGSQSDGTAMATHVSRPTRRAGWSPPPAMPRFSSATRAAARRSFLMAVCCTASRPRSHAGRGPRRCGAPPSWSTCGSTTSPGESSRCRSRFATDSRCSARRRRSP